MAIASVLADVIGGSFVGREWTLVSSRLPSLSSIAVGGLSRGTLIVGTIGALLSMLILVASNRRTTRLTRLTQALESTADSLALELADRKAAERLLRLTSTIIENSPVVIANFRISDSPDLPQTIVPDYISSNCVQFGYQVQDLLSGKIDFFRDVVHPQDRERPLAAIAAALRGGQPEAEADYRLLTADGQVRWVEGRIKFERDTTTGVLYGQAMLRDITERKKADEALSESEQKFHAVADAAQDAIITIDSTGRICYWNRAAGTILGYSECEALGKNIHEWLTPAAFRDAAVAGVAHFDRTGEGPILGTIRELAAIRKDGLEVPIELSVAAMEIAGKRYALGILRDITERKQAELELRYRDAILHAIMIGATEILSTASLDQAMPKVLKTVGTTIGVERVVVLAVQNGWHEEPGPSLAYVWQTSDVPRVRPEQFAKYSLDDPDIHAWQEPLRERRPIVCTVREVSGSVLQIFSDLRIQSMLRVPIYIEGTWWGILGIDDCRTERNWNRAEIDTVMTLADVIGAAVARERYIMALANADMIVRDSTTILFRLIAAADFPIIYISPNVSRIGPKAADFTTTSEWLRAFVHPEDRTAVEVALAGLLKSDTGPCSLEIRIVTGVEMNRWFALRLTPVRDHQGKLTQVEGIAHDVTDRKAAEQTILQMARNDALTGLPNRIVFIEALKQASARARRDATKVAVLYLDLDHFKNINDTLGHPVGDLLLQSVAALLESSVRATDTVSRFGGDEFAILQTDLKNSSDAAILAGNILDAFGKQLTIAGNEVQTGASIGIAIDDEDHPDPETLLSHADVALYRAKTDGRNTFRFFTDAMDEEVRSEVTLIGELRAAIAADQFFLLYQPQVELKSGRLIGLEALVRWRHPRRGIVLPDEFIPAAERSGIIIALGAWVLRATCRQAKVWLDAGILPAVIGANVSVLQLKAAKELESDLTTVLAETGLPPSRLELELTETAIMEVRMNHQESLARLRDIGVRTAIDDFGTGYSSLDYLRRLPVDRLKIAPTFVSRITSNSGEAAIVKATIGLARELGIQLVAEGVETEEQAKLLMAWDCPQAQGFYFSEPLAVEDLTALLKRGEIVRPKAKDRATAVV